MTFGILGRLWREYMAPHRWSLLGGLVCMSLSALATAVLIHFLQPLFDDIFGKQNPARIVSLSGMILSVFVVKGHAEYGSTLAMTWVGQKMTATLQTHTFDRLVEADLAFFHEKPSGGLLSLLIYDTQLVRNGMTHTIVAIGRDILTLIFLVGSMFYKDCF